MNKFLQQLDTNPTLEWKFVFDEHVLHARNIILLHGVSEHTCTNTVNNNSSVRTHVITATTDACVPVDLQLRIVCKPGSYFVIKSIWCDSVNLWNNYRSCFRALPSTVSVAESRIVEPCVLKFTTPEPFYRWLHSEDQLGWLLQPISNS